MSEPGLSEPGFMGLKDCEDIVKRKSRKRLYD